MPRRGENIFKRSDGRWEARYIHHYENGRASYRYIYGKTYSEAKAKRAAEMAHFGDRRYFQSRKSNNFQTLSEEWLSSIKNSVKESTYTRYHRIVYRYLVSRFSGYAIDRIDVPLVNAAVNDWLRSGGLKGRALSAKTVSDILSVLKSIMKYGENNQYPCVGINSVKYPSVKKNVIKVMTDSDLKVVEKQLFSTNDNTEIGFLLALYTGIRIGELCGLKWEDVDLKNRIIHIRRTVERISDLNPQSGKKTKIVIDEPKTKSSLRDIPLTSFLSERLEKMRGNADDDSFVIGGGRSCKEPHWVYLHYKRFIKMYNIADNTFHALRHTFATKCIEAGVDSKSLSELLGHASISTTMSIYVHPSIEQKRKLLEQLFAQSI